ncbi:MAG: hypothetical protein AB7Q45_16545 [Planctomycetaceae bacterium]
MSREKLVVRLTAAWRLVTVSSRDQAGRAGRKQLPRRLDAGGERDRSDVLAATFSVVETCRRLGRDPHPHPHLHAAITAHLQNHPAPRLITNN